jgi:UDP-GlcNAc3NAcA epimerase
MTGRMLEQLEQLMLEQKPDAVLVYGDTNSTLAGALAAAKLHIPVAHVEAGLRSFNMKMPEEINRILTDRISTLLFCPTDKAVENLKNEGFDSFHYAKVIRTGDVMKDAAKLFEPYALKPDFDLPQNYILATVHRAENTDDLDRLISIFSAFDQISTQLPVVIPLHPRTKNILDRNNLNWPNIIIVPPVGYLQMIYLIKHARLIMTDSGGLQKEAFFYGKPCITLRDETEWVELVQHGVNIVVGASKEKILQALDYFLNNQPNFDLPLYGDGNTAKQIVQYLYNLLN